MKYLLIPLAVLLMASSAQQTIDLNFETINIPITGQSFAILLLAFLLGKIYGTLTVLAYLIIGFLGFPVFADGASGIGIFQKGSAGFLIGFLPAAFLAGFLGDLNFGNSLVKTIFAMFISTVLLIVCGVAWLASKYGFSKALEYGFYPFIPGATIKILLSGILAFLIEKYFLKSNRIFSE